MYSARNVSKFQRHRLFYYEVKDNRYFGCVRILRQIQERHTPDKVQEGVGIN